jgi:hypothetical protein
MSRTLQFKRYANTTLASITGADGELIIDTTNRYLTLHDGATPGGIRSFGAPANRLINGANTLLLTANGNLNLPNGFLRFTDSSTQVTAFSTFYINTINSTSANVFLLQSTSANSTWVTNTDGKMQSAYNQANAAAQIIPQNPQTSNYVLQSSDAGKFIYYTQSANTTFYIPWTANTTWANGTSIMIVSQTPAGANVKISPNNGVSLYLAGNSVSSSRNVATYGMATLLMVSANTWFINGTGVV